MKSILENFFSGKLSPDLWTLEKDSQYEQALSAVVTSENELTAGLDDEQKIIFRKYADAQSELMSIITIKNMVHSYKLGLLMTAEAFITSGDMFDDEV